jgi:hypothetical protein
MSGANRVWCLAVWPCLLFSSCREGQPAGPSGADTGRQQITQKADEEHTSPLTGKEKGVRDAERDREKGILKLKEYPPLPYSLTDIRYITLLKERCGVEHEVLGGGNDQDLRAEAQAYNGIMSAAIREKFGDEILTRLRQEASRR